MHADRPPGWIPLPRRLIAWLLLLLFAVHIGLIAAAAYTIADPYTIEQIGTALFVLGGIANIAVFRRFRAPAERTGNTGPIGQRHHILERSIHAIALLGLFAAQLQILELPVT